MTNDARARLGRRLWSARLTHHPKITMKREDAEALPIFYWANKLTGVQRCKYYKRIHIFSTLLLTLTVRYLCFLYLHRHDDERCKGKAGVQALVGKADAPSQNYDETKRHGSAAHSLLGEQIDRGAAM
jgi:hypothetical protein